MVPGFFDKVHIKMIIVHRPRLFVALLIGMFFTASLRAEDWPQFRGPNCSGISTSSATLPTVFSATENVRWAADLGDGIGSPVVAAGRVFTSEMSSDQQSVILRGFDAGSGRQLWQRAWPTGQLVDVHKTNSHAATTPAADADRVYFYFSTLGLIAVDAKTGEDSWHLEMPTPYFVFKWGPAMSPVLYKDSVIFCQDDDLFPAIYSIDKASGKVIWKDDRNDMAVNYSHPVICSTPSGDEIVVAGTGSLVGYDPSTGDRLWKAAVLLRNIKTTPVAKDGVIYISLQSSGIANQWLATADRSETGNSDGKLTKAEMQAFVGDVEIPASFFAKTFDRGDLDKSGSLEGEELDIAFLSPENFAGARFDDETPGDEYVMAVRGGGRGDVTGSHVLWKNPTKYTDHIVSPLVTDERMLLVKGGGISTSFDIQKGKSLGRPQRIQNTCEYFASPIMGDGKIYIGGENGTVVVLADSRKINILARNDMGDAILATPAISDGGIFIRTRSKLICVSE